MFANSKWLNKRETLHARVIFQMSNVHGVNPINIRCQFLILVALKKKNRRFVPQNWLSIKAM